ncbi:MAG: DUF4346 domain-containing protein [Vampirovibrio sp.]|nr:DUF4346 domain-containing protein [Vampirovibrio sp.]
MQIGPVAVCTLADDALNSQLTALAEMKDVLVAPLTTENIGIEQIIQFCTQNPGTIRWIVVCGTDARQAIGYRPGQTLISLGQNGMDETGRIIGAEGKRPVLKNVTQAEVAYFRKTVQLVDLVDTSDQETVLEAFKTCLSAKISPVEPFESVQTAPEVSVLPGTTPDRMVSDPAGYMVIQILPDEALLSLTHFTADGRMNGVVKALTGSEIYHTVIAQEWVSRLDHACYLGRELQKAEHALKTGSVYVQDEEASVSKAKASQPVTIK